MHNKSCILAFATILALSIEYSNGETPPKSYIDKFELARYMGEWYEIARFENRFERDMECVTAQYREVEGGGIEVINRGYNTKKQECSEARGRAKMGDEEGLLKVSFFLFFYADYRILALGDVDQDMQYQWALVGSKSPKYLWILARSSSLSPSTLDHIMAIAQRCGYDTSQLKFVDHE